MKLIKISAAWLAAALLASVGASIASSQSVIGALIDVGASISFSQRISMTINDLAILQTLLPVMAACTLVGFIVAYWCHRFFAGSRPLWYIAAGATSIACTLLLMSAVMNLMPIAGARDWAGMLLISVSGGLGGWLFSFFTRAQLPHHV